MSLYYIEAPLNGSTVIYTLDATTEISYTLTSTITSHPVEKQSDVSDHIVNQNKSITFVGYISDVKSVSTRNQGPVDPSRVSQNTKDYIEGLEDLRTDKTLFTVHFSDKLVPLTNCFFEEVSIEQSLDHGSLLTGPESINSYKVKLTIKQLRLTQRAKETTIRADEIEDITTSKANASGATSFEDKEFQVETLRQKGNTLVEEGTIGTESVLLGGG